MSQFKKILMTTLAIGTFALTTQSATAGMLWNDFSAQQLATVKVDISDAIAKAEEMQAGKVVCAKLKEYDKKLAYHVKFMNNGKEMTVMVDAITGQVIPYKD